LFLIKVWQKYYNIALKKKKKIVVNNLSPLQFFQKNKNFYNYFKNVKFLLGNILIY